MPDDERDVNFNFNVINGPHVFIAVVGFIFALSQFTKAVILCYSSDLVGGRTLQTQNAVQRRLSFFTTQM